LVQLQRFLPAVAVRYFGQSACCSDEDPGSVDSVHERFNPEEAGDMIEFTPDAVFSLTHRELEKTLLFFLEADRATEPLTSARGGGRGIYSKVAAYQAYLRVGQYKRYEDVLRTKLRGFRLLLLVDGATRLAALCRLVRETPPSDFIWLTSREQLIQSGCWAAIWTVGGRMTDPLQSILGTKMPQPCPTPSELAKRPPIGSAPSATPGASPAATERTPSSA
jgi:hypothetical protein